MAKQQAFKVRELMISVLPADVEHETINQDCGYCTTCTTNQDCGYCTTCTTDLYHCNHLYQLIVIAVAVAVIAPPATN